MSSLTILKDLGQVPEGATNISRFKFTFEFQWPVRSAEQIGRSIQLTLSVTHDQQNMAVIEEAASQAIGKLSAHLDGTLVFIAEHGLLGRFVRTVHGASASCHVLMPIHPATLTAVKNLNGRR